MPGIGLLLGAEFLAATGGDMTWFATADRLAAFAGLAPAPWDSGRIRGNLQRPRRYHRGLNRVSCYSALISIRTCPESRAFYDRKRAEGKKHVQAVLAPGPPPRQRPLGTAPRRPRLPAENHQAERARTARNSRLTTTTDPAQRLDERIGKQIEQRQQVNPEDHPRKID